MNASAADDFSWQGSKLRFFALKPSNECAWVGNLRPVLRVKSYAAEQGDSVRREIHIHDNSHACCNGSSRSSARHAAYVSAASMSSGSRYGYKCNTFVLECPTASRPTIVPTISRRLRMHGFPPIRAELKVIRSRCLAFGRWLSSRTRGDALADVA